MKEFLASLLFSVLLVSCSQQGSGPAHETASGSGSQRASNEPIFSREPAQRENARESRADARGAQLAFLQKIRQADPQYQTIERALMNEQNELGVILSRRVDMDQIPTLMRALLKQMAAGFPGEDLTIIAYAPADPPLKIGTGRLDAQTRDMTYTPAARQGI